MKFMLMHVLEELPERASSPDQGPLGDWITEMSARGVILDGAQLRGVEDATSVRSTDGDGVVLDGPFAETKEQIAGFDLIEAADLAEAISVAAAHPTLRTGAIEVRPLAPGMPTPAVTDPKPGKQRYLMFVCWDQTGDPEIADAGEDEDEDEWIERWIAETGERRLHGWQLQPPSLAHVVRNVNGEVVVTDGPFAETKEQIGGYDLLECADLDEAIGIATAHGDGLLELRPVRTT
ncbi:MAG TPA: YciI family protein [Nocardioidaceae bacterium]|nr:YciI family protein [Nocardioidaceae bacterium]